MISREQMSCLFSIVSAQRETDSVWGETMHRLHPEAQSCCYNGSLGGGRTYFAGGGGVYLGAVRDRILKWPPNSHHLINCITPPPNTHTPSVYGVGEGCEYGGCQSVIRLRCTAKVKGSCRWRSQISWFGVHQRWTIKVGPDQSGKSPSKRGTGSFLSTGPLSSGLEEGRSRAVDFLCRGRSLGQRASVLQVQKTAHHLHEPDMRMQPHLRLNSSLARPWAVGSAKACLDSWPAKTVG